MHHNHSKKLAVIGVNHPSVRSGLHLRMLSKVMQCPRIGAEDMVRSEKNLTEQDMLNVASLKAWIFQRRLEERLVLEDVLGDITMVETIVPFLKDRGFRVSTVWMTASGVSANVDPEEIKAFDSLVQPTKTLLQRFGSIFEIDVSGRESDEIRHQIAEFLKIPVRPFPEHSFGSFAAEPAVS